MDQTCPLLVPSLLCPWPSDPEPPAHGHVPHPRERPKTSQRVTAVTNIVLS